MKQHRRALLLCTATILSLLGGCMLKTPPAASQAEPARSAAASQAPAQPASSGGYDENGISAPGVFPITKQTLKMTAGIRQNAQIEDYETNAFTQMVQETCNVDLDFTVFAAGEEGKKKLSVMMASGGELPEVLFGFELADNTLAQYGASNLVRPLGEYYDTQGFYTLQGMEASLKEKNIDIRKWLTMPDGNIYSVPAYQEQLTNEYSGYSWINRAWLEKLNLQAPTTTDELYQVLTAFKTQDPNGNGKADEIPLVGGKGWRQNAADFLMNAFIYDDYINRWVVENGKVGVAFNRDEWREGLRFTNRLCREGLLSPATFTQDAAQLKAMMESESGRLVGAFSAGGYAAVFNPAGDRQWDYDLLLPLKGPAGQQNAARFPTLPIHQFCITKDCKNPVAAFKMADWMWSEEGSMAGRMGIEDVGWRKPQPGEQVQTQFPDKFSVFFITLRPSGAVQNDSWITMSPRYLPSRMMDGEARNEKAPDHLKNRARYEAFGPKEYVTKLSFEPAEYEEFADLQTTINAYVNESLARFAVGDLDVEKDWDGYVKELGNMNLARYLQLAQIGFDRIEH